MLGPQTIAGFVVVPLLVLMAGYTVWRQVRVLRTRQPVSDAEHRHFRGQAYRRLVSAALLLALAGLLGWALFFLEGPVDAALAKDQPDYTPEDRDLFRRWGSVWIAVLALLMSVVLLAGLDLWLTQRFGRREHRKIQADRRAMLQRQADRLRSERNGHG